MNVFSDDNLGISAVDVWPVDVSMTDEFVIAGGSVATAQNLFVRITLRNGGVGYGEIAPFTAVTGEDRATSATTAHKLADIIRGESVARYRRIGAIMQEAYPDQPAARCGLETAVLDAFCRTSGIPLWALWGGAHNANHVETDITIPLLSFDRAAELGHIWYERGFRTLKIKVGKDVGAEVALLAELTRACPDARFVCDANEGFNVNEAASFVRETAARGVHIALFEQPAPKRDLDGMAELRRTTDIPIAADESVNSAADALRVIQAQAADVINLKIMKSGVIETLAIADIARAAGVGLMIGGMVETRLAMGCSLALAIGLGNMRVVDLDTPLLMDDDPLSGGYSYQGSAMSVWTEPGLGMTPLSAP